MRFYAKANLPIDKHGRACLVDLHRLLTITSGPSKFTASSPIVVCRTTRWMDPGLLDQTTLASMGYRPTKESDCYSSEMVIYEMLSGQAPFTPFKGVVFMPKIIKGDCPAKPEEQKGRGSQTAHGRTLGLCWAMEPQSRPSIESCTRAPGTAFRGLEIAPSAGRGRE